MREDQESEIAVIGTHREPNVDRHLAVKLGLVEANASEVLGYFAGALSFGRSFQDHAVLLRGDDRSIFSLGCR